MLEDRDDNTNDDNVSLLTPWYVAHFRLPIHVQHESWNPYRLVEAVQLLRAFSLVTTDSVAGPVSSCSVYIHGVCMSHLKQGGLLRLWVCSVLIHESVSSAWHARFTLLTELRKVALDLDFDMRSPRTTIQATA